jgi:NAD(P)-dependent dehydrogenase (short-subunit alcohol dehydrogenase family)
MHTSSGIEAPASTWDEVFATNVKGVFLVVRAAMPHLRASGHGAVVVISSVQALVTQPDVVAYSGARGH